MNKLASEIMISPVEAGASHAARQNRIETALSGKPDGYSIRSRKAVWVKQTLAGDIFWNNGKTLLSGRQLLENLGGNALEPHLTAALIWGAAA